MEYERNRDAYIEVLEVKFSKTVIESWFNFLGTMLAKETLVSLVPSE